MDYIKNIGAAVSALVALCTGYVFVGGPLPVTQHYLNAHVVSPLNDLALSVLKDRKGLRQTQLFQWERNNPPEGRSAEAALTIQQLKDEISEIDQQIKQHGKHNGS